MEIDVFVLLVCTLIYLAIFSIHLLIRTSKLDIPSLKKYYLGIALFGITFLTSRIIFLINDVMFDITGDEFFYVGSLYVIGNFFASMATFLILLVVEKYVYKKLHFIPTIITLITAILILVLPNINNMSMINIYSIIGALMGAFIPILYIFFGFQVSGETRKKSFILAGSLLIFMVGILTYSDTLQGMLPILKYLSPLLTMIGLGLFHYGFLFYSSS